MLGDDMTGATYRTALFSTTNEVARLNDPGNDGGVAGSVGVWGSGGNAVGVHGIAVGNAAALFGTSANGRACTLRAGIRPR